MIKLFRWQGSLDDLSVAKRAELADRSTSSDDAVRERTAAIVQRVRAGGDSALIELARELDGVALESLSVPKKRRVRALAGLDPSARESLERAAENIASVHRALLPRATEIEVEPGIVVGRRPDPLESVGVYAPGGRAAYPSSVLMGVVPARVAGVARDRFSARRPAPTAQPSDVVLAAAELADVSDVFAHRRRRCDRRDGVTARARIAPVRSNRRTRQRVRRRGEASGLRSHWRSIRPPGPSELLVICRRTRRALTPSRARCSRRPSTIRAPQSWSLR